MEMGGNDALIIAPDADMETAVTAAAVGRLVHSGQICFSPKRILVHRSIKDEFLKRVIEKVDGIAQHTDLNDPAMIMSYLINEKAAVQIEEQIALTVKQGAKLVYGGQRTGTFIQPAVLDGVTRDMDIAKDMEVFGPVLPIICYDTLEEAVEIANSSIYGLSAGIVTSDYKTGVRLAAKLQSGGVVVGGHGMYRTDEMPFGGYKASGIGREGIACALDEMSQIKTTIMKGVLSS
jgi:succinate-semialdehyde dehydrogenase/glutarate-semialdehyde dehydrogenase